MFDCLNEHGFDELLAVCLFLVELAVAFQGHESLVVANREEQVAHGLVVQFGEKKLGKHEQAGRVDVVLLFKQVRRRQVLGRHPL